MRPEHKNLVGSEENLRKDGDMDLRSPRVEKIEIQSTKGKLSAVVHYPKEKSDRLAVLCPGYLDTKDYPHLAGLAEDLSRKGYSVVRFDPTGTWESEGTIKDYNTTQQLEDIKSVVDRMVQDGGYNNILIGGHSRGGMTSILYAARDPRVSAVLGIMPPPVLMGTVNAVGFVMASYDGWVAIAWHLGVMRAFRGRGIARALLQVLGDSLRAQGAKEVWGLVKVDNEIMRKLLPHLGFKEYSTVVIVGRSL